MPGLISTRFRNGKDTPRHERQHCPWCCDQGLVPVGTVRSSSSFKGNLAEADVEQWGPCPNCEAGLALENALYPGGFWQGRVITIEKLCSCNSERAPREQVQAAFELAKQYMKRGNPKPEPDAPRIRHNPGQRLRPGGGDLGAPERAVASPQAPREIEEAAHHRCPGYDGRDMPWPQSSCEACGVTL